MKPTDLSSATRRIALIGIFSALALVLGYVESMIPIPFPVPGMKLGLSNLVIVTALYMIRKRDVLILILIKTALSSLLFGSVMSFWFSLAGGLLSLAGMILILRTEKFSVISMSITGGILHNTGQLLVAVIVMSSVQVVYYFPALALAGGLTGALIGFISKLILPRIRPILR